MGRITAMRTRLVTIVAVVTAALTAGALLAACSDDGGGGNVEAKGSDTPVDLSGEVTNKGTEDLGDATELELEVDDFYFEPTFVRATPGATVTVKIQNEGDANHTFTVDDLSIDQELAPAATAEVSVTVPADGMVNFYCRFHRSQGMQGAVFTQSGQSGGSDEPSGGGTPGY